MHNILTECERYTNTNTLYIGINISQYAYTYGIKICLSHLGIKMEGNNKTVLCFNCKIKLVKNKHTLIEQN